MHDRQPWPSDRSITSTWCHTIRLLFYDRSAILSSERLTRIHDRYKVRLEEGFDHIPIVDVPVIDKSKFEMLLVKIPKDFTRKVTIIKPGDISVPWNEKRGKSNG